MLAREFQQQGLKYSRLLDDICISSRKELSKERSEKLIKKVSDFVKMHGFSLQKSKTRLSNSSNPETLMEITGLWINRGRPRVMRSERISIRTEIHDCIATGKNISRTNPEYHKQYESVSGKTARLKQLGHFESEKYRDALKSVIPHYDRAEIAKTERLAAALVKTKNSDRGKIGHVDRFNQINHRINIIARTNKKKAGELRELIKPHAPTATTKAAKNG